MALSIPHWPEPIGALGNTDLIRCHKTAFLCSRGYPAGVVLGIYDWARAVGEGGGCVLSGFHSPLEQDVFDILLRGGQPLILAEARGLKKRYGGRVQRAVAAGRLLVVSPFPESVRRITAATARRRNAFMLSVAERVVVGHVSDGGALAEALQGVEVDKEVVRLGVG